MKILIAEDDATNQKLLQTILSHYGECDIAVDGEEAVNAVTKMLANQQNYDLITMDLRMPVMNGQEAIREIRKQEIAAGVSKPAIIIVTTVSTDMESIAGALSSQCNAYIVKPINTAKLRTELRDFDLIP